MSKPTIFLNQSTLTDLFTIVFVFVDDYLIALEREGVCSLPKLANQKGSYSELMTIALVGELLKQRYVGDWFAFVKSEYAQLFPVLPDVTRFYRIQNNLERIYADFALRFAATLGTDLVSYVIDSKALPICKGARGKRPRAMTEASSGYSSMGMFYGFKLHAIVDQAGRICRFLLAPAHVSDQEAARTLLAATDALVLGDKNYHGCGVYAQPKANFTHPKPWSSACDWLRKTIEHVFSSLVRSRNLTLGQLNSFRAIRATVCRKIAAHNLTYFLLH
jgi:transposase